MNALAATGGNFSAGLKHENESKSELEKQYEHGNRTEAEEAFQGPKFDPPVYRRRYAAVCELVKKHQAKKVLALPEREDICLQTLLTNIAGPTDVFLRVRC